MLLKKCRLWGIAVLRRPQNKKNSKYYFGSVGRGHKKSVFCILDNVDNAGCPFNSGLFVTRMLRSLLSADGVTPSMITVFIDGYFEVSFCIGILSINGCI